MHPRRPFRKPGAYFLRLGSAVLLFQFASWAAYPRQQQEQQSSQQQQSSQSRQPANSQQPQPNEPKPKKVWTDEDVVSLRTPADIYIAEKEAQKAAEAEAAAKEAAEAKLVQEGGPTAKLAPTIEETQELIETKEAQLSDEENGLERSIKALPAAPEEQKAEMQKEIDRVTADVPRVRIYLQVLRKHLEKLTKARQNQAPGTPPIPPSQ